MKLEKLFSSFENKCKKFEKRANYILEYSHSCDKWEFSYLTETLISDLWQAWCNFCKALVLVSCRGTIDRSNNLIVKLNRDNTRLRILYEVSKNKAGQNITTNGHNNFKSYNDITWGDLSLLIDAINYLSPNNKNKLLSSFGSMPILKELQIVRNCMAHKNKDTLDNCKGISSTYSSIKSPVEIVWSIDSAENIPKIFVWLYYCHLMADNATT